MQKSQNIFKYKKKYESQKIINTQKNRIQKTQKIQNPENQEIKNRNFIETKKNL